jgi:hypothetical protein
MVASIAAAMAALTGLLPNLNVGPSSLPPIWHGEMTLLEKARAVFTDIHFLVCLIVFFCGVALLLLLH